MHFGILGAGRIGLAVARRMKPFDVHLHYVDKHRQPKEVEKELGLTYHKTAESMAEAVDIFSVNCALHPGTEYMVNKKLISHMKRGVYIVNTARGKICNENDIADGVKEGKIAGYAGDVWFPQPAPKDHPWRTMPHHAMTPHTSGTSLSAQARYAAGVREILESFLDGKPIRDEYLIVDKGDLAGAGAHAYERGDATKGSQ